MKAKAYYDTEAINQTIAMWNIQSILMESRGMIIFEEWDSFDIQKRFQTEVSL